MNFRQHEENEFRNLLKYCINPAVFIRTAFFFIQRILFSFQYKYAPATQYYPKKIRELLTEILHKEQTPEYPFTFTKERNKNKHGRIKLVKGYLSYDGFPYWKQIFDDPEETMSIHRWAWLIFALDDPEIRPTHEWGLEMMRSWLQEMGPVPQGVGGTSYTTSERIVNALLFLSRTNTKLSELIIPKDIKSSLQQMAWHVAKHLEYHGIHGTGNHIINNARALLFAGEFLHIPELSQLSFYILKDALPWLITKDGFLREGSSHYHLLFTRWLIEMSQLCKKRHLQEIQNYLHPFVNKVGQQCWFFLVKNKNKKQIPLFGDVSPDCTPQWLLSYLEPHLQNYETSLFKKNGMHPFLESGWFRVNWGVITLFWHIPQESMIHRPHHGHNDACSFVFFKNGEPQIIDRGRLNYKKSDTLSKDYISASGHNSIIINNFPPFVYDKEQKFPRWYQKRNINITWKNSQDKFVFSITHNGFYRIKGKTPLKHTRHFYVHDEWVQIADELNGTEKAYVQTFFHKAPKSHVKITPTYSMCHFKEQEGWTSPEYGVTIPSQTVIVHSITQLPVRLTYRIN